jgi:hypothetical protein
MIGVKMAKRKRPKKYGRVKVRKGSARNGKKNKPKTRKQKPQKRKTTPKGKRKSKSNSNKRRTVVKTTRQKQKQKSKQRTKENKRTKIKSVNAASNRKHVTYRGKDGKFVSKKQWEKQNLPTKPKRSKRVGFSELESFRTKAGYEYRRFELSDYSVESIEEVIRFIEAEKSERGTFFYLRAEYTNQDGEEGYFSHKFMRLNLQNAIHSHNAMEDFGNKYEVARIVSVVMDVTYSMS